jgi:hypothetical protein
MFDVRCFIFLILILSTLAGADSPDSRTVDSVIVGDEQNERDHQLKGEQTETQSFNYSAVRVAGTNGWFSWELKVLPDIPQPTAAAGQRGNSGGR